MKLFLVKSAICLGSLMIGLYLVNLLPFDPSRKLMQFAWFGGRAVLGFMIYFIMAFVLRMEELQTAYNRYIRRFFKKKAASN